VIFIFIQEPPVTVDGASCEKTWSGVHRAGREKTPSSRFGLFALAALVSIWSAQAADLKVGTAQQFNDYIREVEARLAPRFRGEDFLWSDQSAEARKAVTAGKIAVEPAKNKGLLEIKGGLIQDWQGAVFIQGAKLYTVLQVVQDYPNHAKYYSPDVVTSEVVSHKGNHWLVMMRTPKTKLFLSDVLETENDITFENLKATKVYSIAKSSRIQEVANPGKGDEHLLPEGHDRGLLWRLYGYWFYEERDGGVYVECESVTLTRDVPFGMGAVVAPIIRNVPGESLRSSLDHTRQAVLNEMH
jgi:hypothetical protein